MSERDFYLGFSLFSGIGPIKFTALLKHFGSAKDAWSAKENELKSVLGEALTLQFVGFRKEFLFVDYEKRLKKAKVSFITLADDEYPSLLKQTNRPPFVLFAKGNLDCFNDLNHLSSIAVVGTRKITSYGRDVTQLLTTELVSQGFTIVSGLAFGVDAVAHKTAIDNGGKTIAVLGCGVDCCTPTENQSLYEEILDCGGCIISELPLGHPPSKGSFPSRNRIVAGLSLGVLVTEGAEDSGSLITADYALKYNRKVFAVPGPITSGLSKGPYKLIQQGAKLVTNAKDIIQELGITHSASFDSAWDKSSGQAGIKSTKSIKGSTKEEQVILEILQNEGLHFDEIARKSGIDSAKLGSLLSLMEVKGIIKSGEFGKFFVQ